MVRGVLRFFAVRRLIGIVGAALIVLPPTTGAMAQDGPHVLSVDGATLGTIESDGQLDDLRVTVDVAGDTVTATHVWAIIGSAELRQRTTNGYWVPWSGDVADLIDNGFETQNGKIECKVIDGSIAADNQGITVIVGYRTGETLKSGALGIVPKAGGGS